MTNKMSIETKKVVLGKQYNFEEQADDYFLLEEAECKMLPEGYGQQGRRLIGRRLVLTDKVELRKGLTLKELHIPIVEFNGLLVDSWKAERFSNYLLTEEALEKMGVKLLYCPSYWEQYHGRKAWWPGAAGEGDIVIVASNIADISKNWVKLQYEPEFHKYVEQVKFTTYVVERRKM